MVTRLGNYRVSWRHRAWQLLWQLSIRPIVSSFQSFDENTKLYGCSLWEKRTITEDGRALGSLLPGHHSVYLWPMSAHKHLLREAVWNCLLLQGLLSRKGFYCSSIPILGLSGGQVKMMGWWLTIPQDFRINSSGMAGWTQVHTYRTDQVTVWYLSSMKPVIAPPDPTTWGLRKQ